MYTLKDIAFRTRYEGESLEELIEAVVTNIRHGPLTVFTTLPISFTGKVVREKGGPQKVVLKGKDFTREFTRQCLGEGEMSVSCKPDGEVVPVDTINLSFRDHEDLLTDRGLVWVYPGNVTRSSMVFQKRSNVDAETIREILLAAARTVQEQVLDRLN